MSILLYSAEVARNNIFDLSIERVIYVIYQFNSPHSEVWPPGISVLYNSAPHKRDVYRKSCPWSVLTKKLVAGTLIGFYFLWVTWTSHKDLHPYIKTNSFR